MALHSHSPLTKTLHSQKQFAFFVFLLSNGVTGDRSTETNEQISGCTVLLLIEKWIKLIPKTIGNRKRDWAWGCARGKNTTWENLQIQKHKSGRRSFRSPEWFVLFDMQTFSGGAYPPSATSRTISFSTRCACAWGAPQPFHAISRRTGRRHSVIDSRSVWRRLPMRTVVHVQCIQLFFPQTLLD